MPNIEVMQNLGRVRPRLAGTYDPNQTYSAMSVVLYEGNTYESKQEATGIPPTNATYWQPLTDISQVWVRFADTNPQSDGDILPEGTTGPWMGVYVGNAQAAPTDYTAYDWVKIKGDSGEGTGDMLKAEYDQDGDGIVDNAQRLGGRLPEAYAAADVAMHKNAAATEGNLVAFDEDGNAADSGIADDAVMQKAAAPTSGNLVAFDASGNASNSGVAAANVYDTQQKVVAAVVAGGGSGSGIDADKLDGYHSTSFMRVESLGSAVSHTFAVANGEIAYAVALRSTSMYGVFALTGNSAAVVIIPIQSAQVDATNNGRNVTISASVAITLQVFRTR